MTQVVQLKRSAVPGKMPTTADIDLGELAINTYDGKIYFKKDDGTPIVIPVANSSDVLLKQDTLISGSNIKTINGNSILGSGDLTIAGGGSSMTYPTAGIAVSTGTSWDISITAPSSAIVGVSDSQTLTNKVLDAVTLSNNYTESIYALSGLGPSIKPANGSIQTWTLVGNSTPILGPWTVGQSITLLIDDGSSYSVNWANLSISWKTDSGAAPTLNTTGYTVIQLWKVGTIIYGARVGNA